MKVEWTAEALDRLVEIEEFIAVDNPERARKFVDRLIEKGESLNQFPERGRIVAEFSMPKIREIIENNYRIVYRIKPSEVEILTVFEGHQLIRRDEIFQDE